MPLAPVTFEVGVNPIPIVKRVLGGGAVIVNVGGLDVGSNLAGPDDAILFASEAYARAHNQTDQLYSTSGFFLLSGASISLPADVGEIWAVASKSVTTLTLMQGTADPMPYQL